MDICFPTNFWWFLSVLLPYWEETFPCLWNIAVLIEDALKLSFGGKLTIFTSHQVKQLLNGRGHLWMSDQRILRHQVVLIENPGLTISPCEVLNPATLLPTPKGSLPFHSCLETLDYWTKPWEGLSEDPLTNPEEIWYTDGDCFVLDGKRRAGYAVVSNFETIEAKPLSDTSAQLAELVALTWALELGKGKRVAIYTDSKYAILVLHVHAAIWKERGHLTPESPQSNMVIKFLGSWRQSICLLKFQSPTVKDTKKWAWK